MKETDSLKQRLLDYLKINGKMSVDEMEGICRGFKKKISNGEKRLRDLRAPVLTIKGIKERNPDYDPAIGVIYNDKGNAIIGYTYNQTEYVKSPVVNIPDWFFKPSPKPEKVTPLF